MKQKTIFVWSGILLLALTMGTPAQESWKSDLDLIRHEVRLDIHENLGVLTHVFVVRNKASQSREVTMNLSAPANSAACDVTLLHNIASTERRAKVMEKETAAAIYAAVKKNGVADGEQEILHEGLTRMGFSNEKVLRHLSDFTSEDGRKRILEWEAKKNSTARDLGSLHAGETENRRRAEAEKRAAAEEERRRIAEERERAAAEERRQREGEEPQVKRDPALLQSLGNNEYLLKGYPMLPTSNQTITVVFAFPILNDTDVAHLRQGVYVHPDYKGISDPTALRKVEIPLTFSSNLNRTVKSKELLVVKARSNDVLSGAGSNFARLHPYQTTSREKYEAEAASFLRQKSFSFHYALGGKALAYDFEQIIDWKKIRAYTATKDLTWRQAERAVLAQRDLSAKQKPADPMEVATKARIISDNTALIVIESWVARETGRKVGKTTPEKNVDVAAAKARNVAATKQTDYQLCDYIRKKLDLRTKSRGHHCQEHRGWTNSVEKINWLHENGIDATRSRTGYGFTRFEYVKHRNECPVKVLDIPTLKAHISGLKKTAPAVTERR